MKKDSINELRHEYRRDDLGHGTRSKYYNDFKRGTNLVLLTPDVAKIFADEESVNDTLRALIKVAQKSVGEK